MVDNQMLRLRLAEGGSRIHISLLQDMVWLRKKMVHHMVFLSFWAVDMHFDGTYGRLSCDIL